ncbi:MAG: hypothetical protein ACLFPL_04060 [Candidatus Nanoarchaeia archaeon]
METIEVLSKKIQKLENEVETLKSISYDTILNSDELLELQESLEEYNRGEVFTLEDIENERKLN